MASFSPMLVDVELETVWHSAKIIDYLKNQNTHFMISWHDFEGTPPKIKLVKRLNEMCEYSDTIKIVTTAKKTEDVWRILDLYSIENTSVKFNSICYGRCRYNIKIIMYYVRKCTFHLCLFG